MKTHISDGPYLLGILEFPEQHLVLLWLAVESCVEVSLLLLQLFQGLLQLWL